MKPDYHIYFLTSVTFEALKKTINNADTPEEWGNLGLEWDASEKLVKVYPLGKSDKIIGYLTEEDGKEYIPYLKKGWNNNELFEGSVVSINKQSLDASQRIQVAIGIKKH